MNTTSSHTHDHTINVEITSSPKPSSSSLPSPSPSPSPSSSPKLKFHEILIYTFLCCILTLLWIIPYPIYICVAISAAPILIFSFLITRLLQFFHYNLKYVSDVKRFIRTMLAVLTLIFMFGMGIIVIPIIKTQFKHVHYMGVHIFEWVNCIFIICGFYLFSTIIYLFVMILFKSNEKQFHPNTYAVPEAVTEIIDCLFLWWAEYEILDRIPELKVDVTLFRIPTYEFVQVFIFLLIGNNIIILFTYLLANIPTTFLFSKLTKSKYAREGLELFLGKLADQYRLRYYLKGIRKSITSLLTFLMFILTWKFYFGKYLHHTTLQFGIWTFVSILICAFLWLIKSILLLRWRANSCYDRLSSKILDIGENLYFLVYFAKHVKNPQLLQNIKSSTSTRVSVVEVEHVAITILANTKQLHEENFLLDIKNTIDKDIVCGSQDKRFVRESLKGFILGSNKDKGKMYSCYNQLVKGLCSLRKQNTKNKEKNSDDEEDTNSDWSKFKKLIKDSSIQIQEVDDAKLITWAERAHSRCKSLADTLNSAEEMTSCLSNVLIAFILSISFILWLLFTKLATIKVIILFFSPLVSAAFIFGETCKILFKDMVFIFLACPFAVGDLCLIDDKLLEVKMLSVWKTTFSIVGEGKEFIYPNSELCNKAFINYKTNFDWSEHVEFHVDHLSKDKIHELTTIIEEYLKNKTKFVQEHNFVEVKTSTSGDSIKIGIEFMHNDENLKTNTYDECFKEKRRLRSEFVLYLQGLGIILFNNKNKGSEPSAKTRKNNINKQKSSDEEESDHTESEDNESENENDSSENKDGHS